MTKKKTKQEETEVPQAETPQAETPQAETPQAETTPHSEVPGPGHIPPGMAAMQQLAEEEQKVQQPVVGMTQQAVKILAEMIAICTKRGAFRPNEMAVIGVIYNQLVAHLPQEPEVGTNEQQTEFSFTQPLQPPVQMPQMPMQQAPGQMPQMPMQQPQMPMQQPQMPMQQPQMPMQQSPQVPVSQ